MFGFGFVWWILRWSFATLFFIGVMALAGFYVFNEALAGGEYVTVPDLVLKPYLDARDILARSNLEMGSPEDVFTDKFPDNYVIHQRPAAGKVVRAGRKVYPSVSRMDSETTPNVVGKPLVEAMSILESLQLRPPLSISRVAHRAKKDTIISQDPEAGQKVPRGTEVQLLVSEGLGTTAVTFYMPDLMGMTPEQAAHELAPLNVRATLVKVDGKEPPLNVVIAQRPEAGTLLSAGSAVSYDVRTNAPVPGAWRKVTVVYEIPRYLTEPEVEVRMDAIFKDGTRKTPFPPLEYYVDGLPPKYRPDTKISQSIPFQDELTVEVFLDGVRVRSYYYEGDADAVIRDFQAKQGETSSAGA